ncbi:14095_t:CDS:2 [Acaulospora morrowiae]|uniref:14095_t:CDS:1 n=1 Tax=Acaulospora morrowiae TaxID=94023 RepID=A0A9N9AYJ6_9GLOM|nr:14095_t:CDS:2 [Acaulospora morrowiae]
MFWNSTKNIPDVLLLETKDLQHCNADTISKALFESCTKYNLNLSQCFTFLSNNTNYMSGHTEVLNNFEEMAFGKLPISTGFSKTQHLFNLLYLAWMLHYGYDYSDRDSPLNMRGKIIKSLYKEWLDYQLDKYQHPL